MRLTFTRPASTIRISKRPAESDDARKSPSNQPLQRTGRKASRRRTAVRSAAERKGEQVSEDALNFARAKCFSSPVVIIVSMVGDEKKIVDQENYAACWCAIENLLVAANARGLGSYPSTGDWIDQNFVGPVLGLTEKERPVACIFLGYSEQKTMAKRLPVVRHTTWYTEA